MNNQNLITIEKLAERIGEKVWAKEELKRIYLNHVGYNTKKMSTKTYIFEKDGEFIVSCNIDCPSQPYQWIKSQQKEVIESIYRVIEKALVNTYYVVMDNSTGEYYENESKNSKGILVDADTYTSLEEAQKFIDTEGITDCTIIEQVRDEYDALVKEEMIKRATEREEAEKQQAVIRKQKAKEEEERLTQQAAMVKGQISNGTGSRISHPKFGLGVMIAEDINTITIHFEEVGEKKLLKEFAALTLLP